MWFMDTKSEVALIYERIEDAHKEAALLRLGRDTADSQATGGRLVTMIDSALLRASQGALRRQAARDMRMPRG